MPIHKLLVYDKTSDPRIEGFLKDAHAPGFHNLHKIIVQDLYSTEGQLSQEEKQQLTLKLFMDPAAQSAVWMELPSHLQSTAFEALTLKVLLCSGVNGNRRVVLN